MDWSHTESPAVCADERAMTKPLEFFYDYVSPYTYLANSQLADLECDVIYRPVLLGAIMKSIGNQPPALLKPRGSYLFQDVRRWADLYRLPYKMHPNFPLNTVKALRLAIVAQDAGVFEAIHQALFAAAWQQELDVSDDAVLRKIVADAGGSADDMLQKIASDEVKTRLRSNTDEAISRGVFGAPTFFVDQQMFFGNDRLPFVRAALSG